MTSDLHAIQSAQAAALKRVAKSFKRTAATAAVCEAAGFRADVRHTVTQFISVLAMVGHGLGVAIVPASCALMASSHVLMRRLKGVERKSELVLIAGAERRASPWGDQEMHHAEQELMALGSRLRQLWILR